jgi:hypothetical protein
VRRAERLARARLAATAAIAVTLLAACGGSSQSESNASSATPQRYTGHGNASLGAIKVPPHATLYWHSDGPSVRISSSSGLVLGQGGQANGAAVVAQGTYPNVKVATTGAWFMEVR